MDAAQTEQLSHAGWALMRAGNPRGAIREFKAALASDPEHLDALAGLTQSHLNLDEITEAEEPAGALLRVAPNRAVAHRLRAEILRRRRSHNQAGKAAREAITLDPREPIGYHILALCHSGAKDHQSAVKVCDEGLAVTPASAILLAQRADNLLEIRGWPAAESSVEAALRLSPDSDYVLRVAARAALARNQVERARDLVSVVLRRNANNQEALALFLMTEPHRHRILRALYIFQYWRKGHGLFGRIAFGGAVTLAAAIGLVVMFITNAPGLLVVFGVRMFLKAQYDAHRKEVKAHFAKFALSREF